MASAREAGRALRKCLLGDRASLLGACAGPPAPATWEARLEIHAGHCFALPRASWPALARAQLTRDAVMAALLSEHASRGVVLLAGNGHVRRDLGVPRWLPPELRRRTLAVGYLEAGDEEPVGAFDAVVVTARAEREDPCAAFRSEASFAPPEAKAWTHCAPQRRRTARSRAA